MQRGAVLEGPSNGATCNGVAYFNTFTSYFISRLLDSHKIKNENCREGMALHGMPETQSKKSHHFLVRFRLKGEKKETEKALGQCTGEAESSRCQQGIKS